MVHDCCFGADMIPRKTLNICSPSEFVPDWWANYMYARVPNWGNEELQESLREYRAKYHADLQRGRWLDFQRESDATAFALRWVC